MRLTRRFLFVRRQCWLDDRVGALRFSFYPKIELFAEFFRGARIAWLARPQLELQTRRATVAIGQRLGFANIRPRATVPPPAPPTTAPPATTLAVAFKARFVDFRGLQFLARLPFADRFNRRAFVARRDSRRELRLKRTRHGFTAGHGRTPAVVTAVATTATASASAPSASLTVAMGLALAVVSSFCVSFDWFGLFVLIILAQRQPR
jgi:hypothetical protein